MDRQIAYCLWIMMLALQSAVASAATPRGKTAAVSDGRLPTQGTITLSPDQKSVTLTNTGTIRGRNSFYSFARLDIASGGEVALIEQSPRIRNFLIRVTSGQPSLIDGTLRTENGAQQGGNIYLMNPAGVILNENGRIVTDGHLVITTASAIHLAGGGRFSVARGSDHLLTAQPPVAFGFLARQPASKIVVRGDALQPPTQLTAGSGAALSSAAEDARALSLIGGHIRIQDTTIGAPLGRINLVATGSPASDLNVELGGRTSSMPVLRSSTPEPGGSIHASGSAVVAAFGGSAVLRGRDLEMIDSARLLVEPVAGLTGFAEVEMTRRVSIAGSELTIDGPGISGNSADTEIAAPISIRARRIALGQFAIVQSKAGATGDGGKIVLRAGIIDMSQLAVLDVSSEGPGNAGRIEIRRSGSLSITGVGGIPDPQTPQGRLTGLFAGTGADSTGNAGSILVDVERLNLKSAGSISTSTLAGRKGGGIEVHARRMTIDGLGTSALTGIEARALRDASPEATGGTIKVETGLLDLVNGGVISASTFGPGSGGSVKVTATEGIRIIGFPAVTSPDQSPFTGILARSSPIQGRPEGGQPLGPAGTVWVSVRHGNLLIRGDGARISTRSTDSGVAAGNVDVYVGGRITLADDGASLPAAARVARAAGSEFSDQGGISALSQAGGVNVSVSAAGPIALTRAIINAQAVSSGQAQVTIRTPALSLNNSFINARATEDTSDLPVMITGPVLKSVGSEILTNRPDFHLELNLAGAIAQLSAPLQSPNAVLRDLCARRLAAAGDESTSTFVIIGRGGVEAQPGGLVPDFGLIAPPAPPRP